MYEIKKLQFGEWTTRYAIENNGKPKVLFVHGFGASYSTIIQVLQFKRSYDLITLDLPYHGHSHNSNPEINKVADINELIPFVKNFIKELGIKIDLIICHSMGAIPTLKVLNDGIVDEALFFAPHNYFADEEQNIDEVKTWLIPQTLEQAKTSLLNLSYTKIPQYLSSVDRLAIQSVAASKIKYEKYSNLLEEMFDKNFLENYSHLSFKNNSKKITIVAAENDLYVPLIQLQKISQELNIKLEIIHNAGHAIFFDQIKRCAEIIENKMLQIIANKDWS
ncbi:alpha/beta fold hydrolase [Mycoplasmopsis agassizii]|uniref:Alpha/beta hydrolase n=1 Tax=Mycoplasmopsis agassizii TaxID=33922 RepID=A0ABX4H4H6_9BACT|nr:alpha/beta hydrolase [Mycoplasmopsis agassizii]PAF54797.1 alpha/beta hydrolase [Mycoplasmopsis agassizii]SMC19265.1 Alpha/beta hydrolase family protein [Mycoplasmopsis agassizii]